jgi:hypothetical protein
MRINFLRSSWLLVCFILVTCKPTNGETENDLLKSEVLNPEIIALASRSNARENQILESLGFKKSEDEKSKTTRRFQKEQAKLMSHRRKTSSANDETQSEIDKRLSNTLRVNRLKKLENNEDMPRLLSFYMDRKNKMELRKLKQANLLKKEAPQTGNNLNKKKATPSSQNHQRLLNKVHKEKTPTLSATAAKKDEYFQSPEFISKRADNTLRKNRMKLALEESSDAPVMLSTYLKRKATNERGMLLDKGILPEDNDYDYVSARVARRPSSPNNPFFQNQQPNAQSDDQDYQSS